MKTRIQVLIFIVAFISISIVGCAQVPSEKRATYQTVSSENAKKRLDSEKGIVLRCQRDGVIDNNAKLR